MNWFQSCIHFIFKILSGWIDSKNHVLQDGTVTSMPGLIEENLMLLILENVVLKNIKSMRLDQTIKSIITQNIWMMIQLICRPLSSKVGTFYGLQLMPMEEIELVSLHGYCHVPILTKCWPEELASVCDYESNRLCGTRYWGQRNNP